MKFKLAALPLMVFAASAAAESYQSISEAEYVNAETSGADIDQLNLGTTYYFAPLETMGPLKEFEYIIKTTNLFAGYSYLDFEGGDGDVLSVGGEYFAANGIVAGGGIADFDGTSLYQASVGYLFSPNFLLSLESAKWEDEDAEYFVNARYNHQLTGTDYIGFNFNTDDDFDRRTLSSKFFKALPGQTWLAVEGSYTMVDDGVGPTLGEVLDLEGGYRIGEDRWDLGAEYYFSQETSVNAGYNKAETFDLGVSHFFNRNVAGKLSYATNSDTDIDQFLLGVTVQL